MPNNIQQTKRAAGTMCLACQVSKDYKLEYIGLVPFSVVARHASPQNAWRVCNHGDSTVVAGYLRQELSKDTWSRDLHGVHIVQRAIDDLRNLRARVYSQSLSNLPECRRYADRLYIVII